MHEGENPIVGRMATGEPFTFWDLVAAGRPQALTPENFVREWEVNGWIKFDGEKYHLTDAGKMASFPVAVRPVGLAS